MIRPEDIPSFLAPANLSAEEHVFFKYRFETKQDPRLIAAQLCSEQSTAQWARPGIQEDFRPLHAAKIVSLQEQEKEIYELVVAHPHRNFAGKIPNLLSAAAGEGPFYCPGIETIKWIDVEFPDSYLKKFKGPQLGLKGLREKFKVWDRPFFIGVVKPNIGLAPADFAQLAFESWLGGLDIAKDDEMLGDMEWSSLEERAKLCGKLRKEAEEKTARPKGYLASLTDEIENLEKLLHLSQKLGANLVMINSIFMGLSALRFLCDRSSVPVMSHFTGMACLSRVPNFGISTLVFTKLQRLAGADIIGLAGFGERMHCSEKEVLENIEACLAPMGNILAALPVPGGSDWAGTLPAVYQKIGHENFGFISGRGVFGHPQGPRGGALSLQQAWEAICQKVSLKEFSSRKENLALKMALEAWGEKTH